MRGILPFNMTEHCKAIGIDKQDSTVTQSEFVTLTVNRAMANGMNENDARQYMAGNGNLYWVRRFSNFKYNKADKATQQALTIAELQAQLAALRGNKS